MKQHYLIRLDDACPYMDVEKWTRIESLLALHGVKPMVGIVPDCHDDVLMCQDQNSLFWEKAKEWQEKGWAIAMHGYDHCYISEEGLRGINPMWKRSEFAGVSMETQREKIRKGLAIMKEYGLNPRYFFAPSHTFDENTLDALRKESDIRIISDTIGRYPYKKEDFWFVPQIVGHCVEMPIAGIYTFCFHPNMMDDASFNILEDFLNLHGESFIGFDQIDLSEFGRKGILDRFLSYLFFNYRRIRGLR